MIRCEPEERGLAPRWIDNRNVDGVLDMPRGLTGRNALSQVLNLPGADDNVNLARLLGIQPSNNHLHQAKAGDHRTKGYYLLQHSHRSVIGDIRPALAEMNTSVIEKRQQCFTRLAH